MRILLAIILCSFLSLVYGQRESYNWYFGTNAGLKFSDTDVQAVTDGKLNTSEGCASISDSLGNLLFYTDGVRIWNKNHQIMESGLNGDQSSTQSAVVIKSPGNNQKYLVFTSSGRDKGVQYTEVDMSLNSGSGGITPSKKNASLIKSSLEKITAVKHANQEEFWVIGHKIDGRNFMVFKVNTNGDVQNTLNVNIGPNISDGIGYMKISPNGRRLVMANSFRGSIDVFDFNPKTGEISNHVQADSFQGLTPYGIEFSPDGNSMFVSTIQNAQDTSYIFQYSLLGNDIKGSKEEIYKYRGNIGALQVAADGMIYVAQGNSLYLSRIEKPNSPGSESQFVADAIYLNGQRSRLGLPTFVQSYFIDADFVYDGYCSEQTVEFRSLTTTADSVRWDFGDPSSQEKNSNTDLITSHVFNTPGTYVVKLTTYLAGDFHQYSETVEIQPTPVLDFGNDTFHCDIGSVELSIPYPQASVVWMDDDVSLNKTADVSKQYWAKADLNGCIHADTVYLEFFDTPDESNAQIDACNDDEVLLEANTENSSYLWSDNSKSAFIYAYTAGAYEVEVSNKCGIDTARFTVDYHDCSCKAYVPNAITVNGDGLNDHFKPYLVCELEISEYLIQVYNRWGNLVFKSEDPNEAYYPSPQDGPLLIWVLTFKTDKYTTNISELESGVLHIIK
ncbi:MAG: gliding motility-associated C-terminal domain-containing protein [Bacteroidia bacterium]